VIQARLALARAERRLLDRLEELERRLDAGENLWAEYFACAAALAAIAPQIVPGADGALLDTKSMAARMGISPKTLLRQRADGKIAPAKILGKRGRAAFRWAAR
jgi:hypothetical protein